ncbi:hypothetical protein [Mycobacterium sp.]|uniref:hypothetical protein n=1 Tax=Mycobacterium sp. TaxID=1785 RepID=UPI003423E58A
MPCSACGGQADSTPVSSFNAEIGGRRNVAYVELKNGFGVKANDVVMSLVSGVLRQYLVDRNALPISSLVASLICTPKSRIRAAPVSHFSGEFGCKRT